ncbi:hypothetical protein HQ524_04810 [Candidatus Uhrbacteria bacterium]|nr:hypothetical protein [Candidatus Uhrbacteria bacterium]
MTKFLQTLIILVPVMMLGAVVFNYLDLDGVKTVVWEPGSQSTFIHGLRPSGRVDTTLRVGSENFARLYGDPIYLSVTPPGNYQTVDVSMWIDPKDQPVVELGATVNASAGQIDLRPIVHQTIDNLKWEQTRQGDLFFLQREHVYDNLSAFLDDPPSLSEIATYHYDLPEQDLVPRDWLRGSAARQSNVSLRGFHEFVAATDGRQFEMEVMYMDMNRNPGEEPVAIRVYQDGEVVGEVKADDDGDASSSNVALERKFLRVEAPGLSPGLIKVELNAGNDVYWRVVNTNVPKMTYSSNVHIGDEVGYLDDARPVTLYTDAQHLTLFTRHAEGVQTVKVGNKEVEIAIPHERYNIENDSVGITKIVIPRGDLLVVTDGRIAFSKDAFFNPFPVKLDDRTNLDKLGVNYVVAEYKPTTSDRRWEVAETTFALANLERESATGDPTAKELEEGSYRFVISLPRVADRDASIDVKKIEMTFKRPERTLQDVLKLIFKKLE